MSPDLANSNARLNREAVAVELRRYLDTVLRAGRFQLTFRIELQEPPAEDLETPEIVVNFDGLDRDLLLEHGAELLKALEYVAVRGLRLEPSLHDRVRFDCGNYRADRLAELKLSAQVAADRVRETRAAFRFNPMAPRERRIIHLTLKEQPGVRTTSEGQGDDRRVVVLPAEAK
jgi:spoIIIJ-associated protein